MNERCCTKSFVSLLVGKLKISSAPNTYCQMGTIFPWFYVKWPSSFIDKYKKIWEYLNFIKLLDLTGNQSEKLFHMFSIEIFWFLHLHIFLENCRFSADWLKDNKHSSTWKNGDFCPRQSNESPDWLRARHDKRKNSHQCCHSRSSRRRRLDDIGNRWAH